MKVKRHYISSGDGTKLYVEETGNFSNDPILFIHGVNQTHQVWKKQVNSKLSTLFHLITMDIRGHGFSDKPYNQYSDSRLWAEDIKAVIDELNLKNVLLVGWSYGGLIVLDYLRHYGEDNIRGVNLVGARTRFGTAEALQETGSRYKLLGANMYSNDYETAIHAIRSFIELCTYKRLSTEDFYFFLGQNVQSPPYVRNGLLQRNLSNEDTLKKLTIPFLITHGNNDEILSVEHAKYNSKLLDSVKLSIYENTGHNPFWEDSFRFNRELIDFSKEIT